jgi:hypothetical protein
LNIKVLKSLIEVHHYMKESDILAKRHEYVGAALLVTKVIGEQNLIRATPVVLTVEDLGQAEEEKTLTGVLAVHPLGKPRPCNRCYLNLHGSQRLDLSLTHDRASPEY